MQEMVTVELTINGEKMSPTVAADTTLLRFLRDELRLTGTKNGCSTNHCGACMVLVNGKATKSCLLQMRKLRKAEVVTIEGLSPPGVLHPIQAAFLAAGGVQCGFCTPGMIISTKALLDANPDPTEDEIREALKDNVCRCTGYIKIIDAVKLAARWLKQPNEMNITSSGGYGESVVDLDGIGKVQGSLEYADDIRLPNMLHAKVVWSAHPHALIKSVDTTAAEQAPGVFKVLSAADVPGHNGFGPLKQDQPVLCGHKVRFVGDAVALVLGQSAAAAEKAADLVTVEYEPLQGVFTPADALKEDAPQVHPEGNVCKHLLHTVGDVEQGLADSHLTVEGRFETPFVEHAYLEPESGVAYWEGDVLVLRIPTQFPFELKAQLAKVLALSEDRIRIRTTPLGGSFGSKTDGTVEPLLALGAYHSRERPVKLTLTREESMKRSTKRHPYVMDYTVGVDESGKLLAVDARLLSDTGAYTNLGPRVIDQACIFACGPYEVPNLRLEGWAVHTNNVNASAFRGFGINQVAVAIESLLDEVARKLDINPFELRRKNALREGSKTAAGEILRHSVAIEETIVEARKALEEELPHIGRLLTPGKRLGIGVASGFKNVGAGKGKVDDAGAIFTLLPGGTVQLRASAVDMGQGIRTALVQIAREMLPLDDPVELITGDTALTPKHGGAVAQRQTLISGNAVMEAARRFKTELLRKAGAILSLPPEELELLAEGIVHPRTETQLSLADLEQELSQRGEKAQASFTYVAPQTFALADAEGRESVPPEQYRNFPGYAYTTQVAALEVDPLTGEVNVLRVLAAHDVGRAINPQKIEGQIEGSCHMAQGYALSEEYPVREGVPAARTYRDLHVPTILDAPPVRTLIVEKPDPTGPLGAKGISEVATVPLTPAILNAIFDAVGVRLYRLPATPARILAGLRQKGHSSHTTVPASAECTNKQVLCTTQVGRALPPTLAEIGT